MTNVLQKVAKIMVTFMAKVKSTIPQKKLLWLLFGLLLQKLGLLVISTSGHTETNVEDRTRGRCDKSGFKVVTLFSFLMDQSWHLFLFYRPFHNPIALVLSITPIDDVLGIRTLGRRTNPQSYDGPVAQTEVGKQYFC